MARQKIEYDERYHGQLIRWMARCGLTDEEMSHQLGISRSLLNRWRRENPDLVKLMQDSKLYFDSMVEDKLAQRALGFEYEEVEEQFTVVDGPDGAELPGKRVKRTKKKALPDVTAQIFWLKNRQPARWRDKQEIKIDGPIVIDLVDD